MTEEPYLDFDLLIQRSERGYTARVVHSPAGQAAADFDLPFSDLEVDNFLLRVGRPRQGVRRLESPELEAAKRFGGRLFEAVFDGPVGVCFHSSLNEAQQRGAGLRIRLRLSDTPELTDLPWEYLYNPDLNRFFSLSIETPLVHYLDLPGRIQPLAVKPPLQVLVMIASPRDYPSLKVEEEWARLKKAVADLEQQGLITLDRLEDATLTALQRRLRQGAYHIFHFIGHGAFDERAEDGVLLLEDEEGRGRPVSGQYVGTLLHDERTLRLAVLNACEGARTSRTDPFAGTAQSLVQQGVPAVIAMQFEITDEAAITLGHEFYAALADGYPVDAALTEARKAIYAKEIGVEWGKPVLYLRAPDGRIFDMERMSDEERGEKQTALLYREAQVAMATEDWMTAIEKLQAILTLEPTHVEAVSSLKQIRQQQQLSVLYTRGRNHYSAGRWREALEYLRQVQSIKLDYKDVAVLIASAEREIERERKEAISSKPSSARPVNWLRVGIPAAVVLFLLICGGAYALIKWSGPVEEPPTPTPTPVAPTPMPTPTPVAPTPMSTPTPVAPAPTPVTPAATPRPSFGYPSFCLEAQVDQQNRRCLVSGELFTGQVETIYVSWPYENVYPNMQFERKWFLDGQQIYSKKSTWDGVDWKLGGTTEYTWLDAEGLFGQKYFRSGYYSVEFYIEGVLEQSGAFTIDQSTDSMLSAEQAIRDYFSLVAQKQYEAAWEMAKYYTEPLHPPTFAQYRKEWEQYMGAPIIQGLIDAREFGDTATMELSIYFSKIGKTYRYRYTLERDYNRGNSRFGYWIFTDGDPVD